MEPPARGRLLQRVEALRRPSKLGSLAAFAGAVAELGFARAPQAAARNSLARPRSKAIVRRTTESIGRDESLRRLLRRCDPGHRLWGSRLRRLSWPDLGRDRVFHARQNGDDFNARFVDEHRFRRGVDFIRGDGPGFSCSYHPRGRAGAGSPHQWERRLRGANWRWAGASSLVDAALGRHSQLVQDNASNARFAAAWRCLCGQRRCLRRDVLPGTAESPEGGRMVRGSDYGGPGAMGRPRPPFRTGTPLYLADAVTNAFNPSQVFVPDGGVGADGG